MVDWTLVKKLIKMVNEEDITGLAVEENGVKYEVRKDKGVHGSLSAANVPVFSPVISAAPEPKAAAAEKSKEEEGLIAITSPMVGTFYRSPSPESPSFVEVGDDVAPGKVVCIIEAMKLFNEIEAEIRGKVVKVLAENGKPVEYGQKLMLIQKS